MKREKEDLSVKSIAMAGTNKTAIIGMVIMNIVLAAAYAIELIKDARSLGSYLVIVAFCVLPCVFAAVLYLRKKDSMAIQYIFAIGFALLYGYVMFTTSTNLTFCYVIVAYVILMVFKDTRMLLGLSAWAIVVNVVLIVRKAAAGNLVGAELTESEIIIACLVLTSVFSVLALKKINQINQANIDRAEAERQQSEAFYRRRLRWRLP